jgi:hypothetical protein
MSLDTVDGRVRAVMEVFACDYEAAQRYLDLRAEGYSRYAASLLSGIADPYVPLGERD